MSRLHCLLISALPDLVCGQAAGAAIYPIDGAHFLAGSRFDRKVEFDRVIPEAAIKATLNGIDAALTFRPLQHG